MKKIIILASLPFLFSCKSQLENGIKETEFEGCPNQTVSQLFEKFLKNTEWESFISPDDNKFHLNVSGKYSDLDGVSHKMLVQFQYTTGDTWEVNAMKIDGKELNDADISNSISFMCESIQ